MKLTKEELNELTRKYYPSKLTLTKEDIMRWAAEDKVEMQDLNTNEPAAQ